MSDANTQRAELMRNSNFRWLLGGGAISMLGDQLTLIALPWLVLRLTGSTLALGLVIALMSVPRAIFILIGGALVDRHSPKRVLMISKFANALLLGLLTLLVLNNRPELHLAFGKLLSLTIVLNARLTLYVIYGLALAIGLAQAFSIPAGSAILPQAIPPRHLHGANGMLMGLRQLAMLAGPLIAAGLIAVAGDSAGTLSDARGLALAFGIDCLSFLLSAWTLSKVTGLQAGAPGPDRASVLRSVAEGLAMVWHDMALRTCFLYWGTVSLFIGGAMQVALPVLASERLHGAAALGVLMAAHGAGSLLGMLGATIGGARQFLFRYASFGSIVLLVDALAGLILMPLGAVSATWQGATLLATVGLLSGFMQITVFTWIQQRVPVQMMGRTMSIFMFIFMGLAPLSAAVTGWLLTLLTLPQLFVGGGALLLVLSALTALLTPMRQIRIVATH